MCFQMDKVIARASRFRVIFLLLVLFYFFYGFCPCMVTQNIYSNFSDVMAPKSTHHFTYMEQKKRKKYRLLQCTANDWKSIFCRATSHPLSIFISSHSLCVLVRRMSFFTYIPSNAITFNGNGLCYCS